jgi:hypothetical protein
MSLRHTREPAQMLARLLVIAQEVAGIIALAAFAH